MTSEMTSQPFPGRQILHFSGSQLLGWDVASVTMKFVLKTFISLLKYLKTEKWTVSSSTSGLDI